MPVLLKLRDFNTSSYSRELRPDFMILKPTEFRENRSNNSRKGKEEYSHYAVNIVICYSNFTSMFVELETSNIEIMEK